MTRTPTCCIRGEPDAWEQARPVRRATARNPLAARPTGASLSTLHVPAIPGFGPLLYEIVAGRYERRPIIITSNKSLTEWSSITQDVSLAADIADRLLHHGEVFYLKGPSWRLKGRGPDHNLHSEAPS